MDAVERADRDRPRLAVELRRRVRDLHRGRPRRRSARAPLERERSVSRSGLLDPERPDLRAPQRRAVAAEHVRDRPHVRPGADAEVERRDSPSVYAMTSSASTRERRRGISTSTPRRWRRYARSPPILTAEAAGIGSSISPRRRASAASSSAARRRLVLARRPRPRGRRSTSGPEVDRPSGSACPVRRSTKPVLVALPDNRSSRPVANGSSVPAWPVRAPVRRRISATTRTTTGPAGLSTRMMPVGSRPRGIRTAVRTTLGCAGAAPQPARGTRRRRTR